MTTEEKIPFTVQFTKPDGSPGEVDDIPVYSVDPAGIAEVINIGADGLSGELSALAVGAGTLSCDGDADLGDGVVHVVLTAQFSVTDVQVTGGTISLGAPVPK
jgi:hypothetical protein